jgi:hypothetical protein
MVGLPFREGVYRIFDMTAASPPSLSEHLKLNPGWALLVLYFTIHLSSVETRIESGCDAKHMLSGADFNVMARSMANARVVGSSGSRRTRSLTTTVRSAEHDSSCRPC